MTNPQGALPAFESSALGDKRCIEIDVLLVPYVIGAIHYLTDEQTFFGDYEDAYESAGAFRQFVQLLSDDIDCEPAPVPNYTEGCRVYWVGGLVIFNNSPTPIPYNFERYDTDNMWTSGANTRLTIKTAGKYLIGANVQWAAGLNVRQAGIRLNGGSNIAQVYDYVSTSAACIQNLSAVWNCAVNDYFELVCMQLSGGNLNMPSANYYTPEFFAQRIG